MPHSESDFEMVTIERLQALGYAHRPGGETARAHDGQVIFSDVLARHLARQYPHVPESTRAEAVRRFTRPEGVDLLRRNMDFHLRLVKGEEFAIERPDGTKEYVHLRALNWDEPEANTFEVVNQLTVTGHNTRRPDIIVYVNGLPLAVFELKSPWSEYADVAGALNQIGHYTHDIPQLFETNAICVVSDGLTTLHGTWPAGLEWYAPWKSIDGTNVEPGTTGSMKTLIEGLFPRERFLSYVRDFVLYENAHEKITKKGAKYHQFFAARIASEKAVEAMRDERTDKRLGVVWHTTGSGKSLSMTFLVGILRRRLNNPSFVIQVDRTDLDDQLHDQFTVARALVGDVKHAENVDSLRSLLRTEGGEVIFTTIERFRLKEDEATHPVLSERRDIIIIADEAHRTQYGFTQGFARYLAEALPNARRLGFTGTPVSFGGADTQQVFGDVLHTYDIEQAQQDGATVKIYYDPRQIRLHLGRRDIDDALDDIAARADPDELTDLERKKARWAALAEAAGAPERVADLARDLLTHYRERTKTLPGKAMAVAMTRRNCVRLYDALTALPGCPEVKIVMTGDITKDPKEWAAAGHISTKAKRDEIKKRMTDPDDPLAIVIVCDMWLTGTDIPCLHTLYIDKPMRGHTIIQAISRVNRVFRDKPSGLIVDYIGIGDDLREATARYTKGGGRGDVAPGIEESAVPLFLECIAAALVALPQEKNYAAWRSLTRLEHEDLCAFVWGTLLADDTNKDAFLQAELRLSKVWLLVKHLDACRPHADFIIICQQLRKGLQKAAPGGTRSRQNLDTAVRGLIDESITSEGVVDIFRSSGLPGAEISILDHDFLQTFKDKPHEDLRLKLLEQLLHDEIVHRSGRNLAQAKSLQELLETTLRNYHNRLIDASAVIQTMVQMRKDMDSTADRAVKLGLSETELAFYDAIASTHGNVYAQPILCEIIRDVVKALKRNLKVDWTDPSRTQVQAEIRSAVRIALRRREVEPEDLDALTDRVIAQAAALFRDWPLAA
jgi:type I restriction enzyme R subunit